MTHDESAHGNEHSEDRFYAQFDSREVELMTLDELAAAFEAGQIHANTFVCREGDSEWLTLAEVAGLGEEDEAEPEPAPVMERRPPMPERRPEMPLAAETRPPMPERRPEMPQRRPEMATEPAARFQAQSVPPAAPSAAAPSLSYAPVTSNLDYSSLDFDELAMRPKRRWGVVLAAAAVLALGGGTVFALNGGGSALASAIPDQAALNAAASHSQASLTLSTLQANKPSEPEPVAPAPAPSAPEPVAAAAPAAEASKPGQLSEDMKQALLASDKSRETKKAKKGKGRATTASAAPRRGGKVAGSGGFKSGGSAYDPLNGKL